MDTQQIILIDGYAQIYRGYYAIRYLKTSSGEPTNAVFAMAKFLLSLEKEHSSVFGAFALDKGKPAFRMELAPDYKANRSPMPDELKQQIPHIREFIDAFGWPILEDEGFEADDIIAGIALKFSDCPVRIVTHDKDIAQLVDDRVKMLVPDKKVGFCLQGPDEVLERYEVRPEQIVDYLSLVGDSSDNIPGVAGVGKKTAAKLINEFGSIDNLLQNIESLANGKIKEKVAASQELLLKNRKLITLKSDISEMNWDLPAISKKAPDLERLTALAEKFELKSIAKDLQNLPTGDNLKLTFEKAPVKTAQPDRNEESEPYTPDLFDF